MNSVLLQPPPIQSSILMKSKYILIAFAFLSITALAQTETVTPPAQAFEPPGRVETKMFIPADLMSGPLHSVGDYAENDGMNNTYFLYSGNDASAVTTGIALGTRIREIYAIDKLRQMSKTDEFARAKDRWCRWYCDESARDDTKHSARCVAILWPHWRRTKRRKDRRRGQRGAKHDWD